jgi:hypothetical protein
MLVRAENARNIPPQKTLNKIGYTQLSTVKLPMHNISNF